MKIKQITVQTKEKKRTPQLRFKEFEGEWVSECFGKYVLQSAFGPRFSSSLYDAGGEIATLRTTDMDLDGNISYETMPFANLTIEEIKDHILKVNDIVISRSGTIGITGVFKDFRMPVVPGAFLIRFRVDTKSVSSDFIKQEFNSPLGRYRLNSLSAGGVQKNLTGTSVKKSEVIFPSLPEQQKIAAFLSAVDKKIQQLTKKAALLEQYKKGVMQQLFSGELRFRDENGEAYPDWDWVRGNKLFNSISDKNHNSDLPILAITQDQGAIPRDLINYQMTVTEKSVASYKVVQVGDFVISLRTFQGGIEFSDYHGICSPAYIILRPISDDIDRTFYKFYLKTSYYIKLLQTKLEGIRDGKMISYKYFSEIKLPFPSLPEQQKIATFLSSIDTKIERVNQQISQSQTFKKGLLQQLFV